MMNLTDLKALICIMIFFISLQLIGLFYNIANLSKDPATKWQECSGTVISKSSSGDILYSYKENGNTHYQVRYRRTINQSEELEKNDIINLFYDKENPERVVYVIPQNASALIIGLLLIGIGICMYPLVAAYKIIHKPKNGLVENLPLVESNGLNPNLNISSYTFLWEKDGKQKNLSAPCTVPEIGYILKDIGITEIICYIKNENATSCYADFDETLEKNNSAISSSRFLFKI